jgi:flagellar P-ring protein precursor FlgI
MLLKFILRLLLSIVFITDVADAQTSRIKNLVNLRGSRTNSLIGFGLVVGLNKTGDSPTSIARNKALNSVLSRLGMSLGDNQLLTSSAAAVIVTADLPAFAKIGDQIDVKVSVIGDAKSLAGGNLLMTPLKAGDGQIYAVADGTILIGQATGAGAKVQTVALIPNGAHIERDFVPELMKDRAIDMSLKTADFTTAARITTTINNHFHDVIARAADPSHIKVRIPNDYVSNLTGFIAELELLEVVADQKAVVIVNERTGTVVMGGEIRIADIAISHNGVSIQVGNGKDAKAESMKVMPGGTVGDLVKGLNQMGVKPDDLISILQSIHASGALKAELRLL